MSVNYVHVFGPDPRDPVHVEMVAADRSRAQAQTRLAAAVKGDPDLPDDAVEASIEGGKVYVDVLLAGGKVRLHIAIDPAKAAEADQVLEDDSEGKRCQEPILRYPKT